MEFQSVLYQLIFMPLQIVFEIIYYMAFKLIGNPGVSIVALSLVVNLLVLPLYNRADAIQEAERDIEAKLRKGVEHIKKTFKGDEQLMMLQTYYRQNGYSPLDSIKGSISLFLEIPFFVAAYQFLSHLDLLNGASLGPIKDLGAPDGLLTVAGMTINVLPFVMTAVNLVSAYIFTKDLTSKTKVQLYGMASFFLIFLYASPAGLVVYWTLNNIFNLIKTIICKLNNVDRGINLSFAMLSICVLVYGYFYAPNLNVRKILCFMVFALLLNLRFILRIVKEKVCICKEDASSNPNKNLFFAGAFFLAILIGGLIPSSVIVSSPSEFIIMGYFNNPLWYIVSSVSIAFGTFVLWGGVFYWLADDKNKVFIEKIVFIGCIIALVNYMFFGKNLGIISSTLQYDNGMHFSKNERLLNTSIVLFLIITLNFLWNRIKRYAHEVILITTVALTGMSLMNIFNIDKVLVPIKESNKKTHSSELFALSKNGKNVIVIMLDMALGQYVPYIFNEKPELKEKFSGFIYYSNVISHGGHTNYGAPGLFGGYEYTPLEMNKRDKDLLATKHNEALKVMPVIFDKSGFKVTVCDPPLVNYKYGSSDLSIYDDYKNVNAYVTIGKFGIDGEDSQDMMNAIDVNANLRNFYNYGIVKSVPVVVQKYLYDNGQYNVIRKKLPNQTITSMYTAKYNNNRFMNNYNVLNNLNKMTKVVENDDTLLILTSEITHVPCLLQLPDYVPKQLVDNSSFKNDLSKHMVDDRKLRMDNTKHISYYHSNMAALMQLGKYFDFLRHNNIFDNTRIIIVSDHGTRLHQLDNLVLNNGKRNIDSVEIFFPLLMVKDFNSNKFNVSDEFMTNADVPFLATRDLIFNPKNPFTGKKLGSTEYKMKKQYILAGSKWWNATKNNGTKFKADAWYSVHTNIWDKKNWKLEAENAILPQ